MGHPHKKKRRRRQTPGRSKTSANASPPTERRAITIGTIVGGYRIVEWLGRGGMASAYRGCHAADKVRHVTIKVLRAEHDDNASVAEYFAFEAACLARLNHPHLPKLVKMGKAYGKTYLIATYAPGAPVFHFRPNASMRSRVQGVADLTLQVVSALMTLQAAGILHRDIKEENIPVQDGDAPYATVIDLGLARFYHPNMDVPMSGTVEVAAPQQLDAKSMDFRDDQFSLGLVVYRWLTGRHPADGTPHEPSKTLRDLYAKAMIGGRVRFIRLDERSRSIPAPLVDDIMRMLSFERDGRFATWLEVAHAFLPYASPHGRETFTARHAPGLAGWTPTVLTTPARTSLIGLIRLKERSANHDDEKRARRTRLVFYALVSAIIAAVVWRCGRPP